MPDKTISWEEEKAIHAGLQQRREAIAELERASARAAVAMALRSYRWWGWNNLVNNVRLFIQAWRQR
jgi:hypothetical protein